MIFLLKTFGCLNKGLYFRTAQSWPTRSLRRISNLVQCKWIFSTPAPSCCFRGPTRTWLRWAGWSGTTKGVSVKMHCHSAILALELNLHLRLCLSKPGLKCSTAWDSCFHGFIVQKQTWIDLFKIPQALSANEMQPPQIQGGSGHTSTSN